MPYPDEVVLPLRQHAGKPAKLVVAKGQHVERGDVLAAADGWVSSPVHASASGWVSDIDWWPHPDGSMCRRCASASSATRRRSRGRGSSPTGTA